jgi:hypothetical protein
LDKVKYPDGLEVACGKCMHCRIQIRKEWAMRCLHELAYHEDSIFITLTYDDINLPDNASLCKKDLQKFFKRLRRSLNVRKIRYFACGEYGEKSYRPHYHAIIFGMSLSVEDRQSIMDAWPYCAWDNKAIARDSFGLAERDSISYVSQYIDKKLSGVKAYEEFTCTGREDTFKIASLGIGRNYIKENADQLVRNGYCTVNGVMHSIPRYYLEKLGVPSELFSKNAVVKSCNDNHEIIGRYIDDEDAYRQLGTSEFVKLNEVKKSKRRQHDINIKAKSQLKSKVL